MRKVLKRNGCKYASHQLFRDKAKNRVDDLQTVFSDLQSARKESRTVDAVVLEEQVYQMLREWKSELNEPSPASSLQNDSIGAFSSDIYRLLHLCEEEDDATSPLELRPPKPELDVQNLPYGSNIVFQEHALDVKYRPQEHDFLSIDQSKGCSLGYRNSALTNLNTTNQLDFNQFLHLDLDHHYLNGFNGIGATLGPNIGPPPSAFLGPKCGLWDCPRPASGSDYCSSFHATLALNEGPPGMTPVIRPGGIGIKDSLLFAALSAKTQGKDVGIPECEGAATSKSPWNAPELFDLSVLEGETIREWLFFDKPRRAFESGNRKQRSLPDYSGRGWHESRKQVMNEFGGLKRSYYMDPQPLNNYEWHLYEYEINKCDVCALYRLELKLVDGKKTPRGKTVNDSVSELQKQMGRLIAEFPHDNKRPTKGRTRINNKDGMGSLYFAPNQLVDSNDPFDYGVDAPFGYLVDSLNDDYCHK